MVTNSCLEILWLFLMDVCVAQANQERRCCLLQPTSPAGSIANPSIHGIFKPLKRRTWKWRQQAECCFTLMTSWFESCAHSGTVFSLWLSAAAAKGPKTLYAADIMIGKLCPQRESQRDGPSSLTLIACPSPNGLHRLNCFVLASKTLLICSSSQSSKAQDLWGSYFFCI